MNTHIKTQTDFLAFEKWFVDCKIKVLKCQECLGNMHRTANYRFARCGRAKCRKRFCVYKTETFKNSKLDKETLMKLLYYLTTGFPTTSIFSILSFEKKTVRKYKKALKRLLKSEFSTHYNQIGGEGVVVEVDESKFGKRKYNKGRCIEGVWVLGLVERTSHKRVIFIKVDKRDKTTLSEKIIKYVRPKTTIYSDIWKGYNGLTEYNFIHKTVNHSQNFVNPVTGTHTQTIEGTWSGLKQAPQMNDFDDAGFIPSSPKHEFTRKKNVRNLTIKQLNTLNVDTTPYKVDNSEVNTVILAGWPRNIKKINSGSAFTLDDKTGTIECTFWYNNPFDEDMVGNLVEKRLVKLCGSIRVFNGKTNFTCTRIVRVEDTNFYTYHLTACVYQHLFFNNKLKREVKLKSSNIQDDILDTYRKNQDENGLHVDVVVRMLTGKYGENEVRENIEILLNECLLYSVDGLEYRTTT